jgi:segregation and condensation protein B
MSEIAHLKQIIEGAIMAADQPLAIDLMINLFETDPPDRADILQVLTEIAADCEGRGFELKQVASGYRFQVRSDYGQWVSRLWEERPARYTRALLETLALIAYKQPITRGDIEEIRGVTVSTNIMRSLLEREWIRVVGHRDVPGRPAIYATTRTFDLKTLNELPTLSQIKDLDKINEELDLEDEIVEARSIELTPEQDAAEADAEDASLDEVTDRVNEIQENIKNMFRQETPDTGEIDELEELDKPEVSRAQGNPDGRPQ